MGSEGGQGPASCGIGAMCCMRSSVAAPLAAVRQLPLSSKDSGIVSEPHTAGCVVHHGKKACLGHVLAFDDVLDNRVCVWRPCKVHTSECMGFRPPRHVMTPEVEAAEADLHHLQQHLMNQQAELGARRADVQVASLPGFTCPMLQLIPFWA